MPPRLPRLRIPRFWRGGFFPTLLEPRRGVDRVLWAVMMAPYIGGVSTCKVDELVVALGCDSGISKSGVSHICQALDLPVQAFLIRRATPAHKVFRFMKSSDNTLRVN